MKYSLKILPSVFLLLFSSCSKDSVTNPPIEPEKYYKVVFETSGYDGILANVNIELDSWNGITDSSGLLQFDSIKTGSSLIRFSHKDYRTVESSLTIGSDTVISITMKLKSDSFFPMTVGSKWIYKESENRRSIIEVTGLEFIEGFTYTKFTEVMTRNDEVISTYDRFYRISSDTLYEYIGGAYAQEAIYALFNKPVDTEFENTTVNNWTRIGKIFVKEKSLICIYYDIPLIFDDEFTVHFRRGVGMELKGGAWQVYFYLLEDYDIKY